MTRPMQLNTTSAALWASAFVIAALVIVQAGRLPVPAAHGEMAASRADYTLLTARSGKGRDTKPHDILYVIDNRDQVLMVYFMEDARRGQILPIDGGPIDNLFRGARR